MPPTCRAPLPLLALEHRYCSNLSTLPLAIKLNLVPTASIFDLRHQDQVSLAPTFTFTFTFCSLLEPGLAQHPLLPTPPCAPEEDTKSHSLASFAALGSPGALIKSVCGVDRDRLDGLSGGTRTERSFLILSNVLRQ